MKIRVLRSWLECISVFGVMFAISGCATPLQKATMQGDTKRIETLLNQGHNVNEFKTYPARFPELYPPAWIAVINNDEQTLRFLLDKGASMVWEGPEHSDTLLHEAAGTFKWWEKDMPSGSASASIIELLISRGCDVGAFRSNNMIQRITPLHMAAGSGDSEVVSLLLECGADPHSRNSQGDSPLDWAKKSRPANDPQRRHIIETLEKIMAQRPAALGDGLGVAPAPIEVPEMNVPE